MFNTSTLGYKLMSGYFKSHSEQLNKYVAGLFDSDGSVGLAFKEHSNGRGSVYLQLTIGLSASTDPDFALLRALCNHYRLGKVYYALSNSPIAKSSLGSWRLNSKESRKFLNVIMKHLLIKGSHADNLLWLVDELDGYTIKWDVLNELREFSKCSRDNSKWLKKPKHPSWPWLAGYLDGDGHYRCRLNSVRKGSTSLRNELKLFVGASITDGFILEFLKEHIGGSLRLRKDSLWFLQLALGKGSRVYAIKFLKQMQKYCCLENKHRVICSMLNYHLPAETKQ
jgi:hypothetical protein